MVGLSITSRKGGLLKYSYYVPNNGAALPSYTILTELHTGYFVIFHVSLLSYIYIKIYIYIYVLLLTFLITHKVVHLLEFLGSDGKAAKDSGHLFQHLRFLPQLLSR